MRIPFYVIAGVILLIAAIVVVMAVVPKKKTPTPPSDPCAGVSCAHGKCSQGKCVCDKGYSGPKCDQVLFSQVNGITNAGGFCRGAKDVWPYWKSIPGPITKDQCQAQCLADSNCIAFNVNDGSCGTCTSYQCQLYSNTQAPGYNGAHSGWKPGAFFPQYASQWTCPDPIPYPKNPGGCISSYPDACAEQAGWSCYTKGSFTPTIPSGPY